MPNEPDSPKVLDYARADASTGTTRLDSFVAILGGISLIYGLLAYVTLDGGELARATLPPLGLIQTAFAGLAVSRTRRTGRRPRLAVIWTLIQGPLTLGLGVYMWF